MEKVEIFYNEPLFHCYNIQRFLLILIQILFQLQYFACLLGGSGSSSWIFMNIFNFLYLCYLFLDRNNLTEAYRLAMFKDQLFLTIVYYTRERSIVYCLIPCLIITSVIYAVFHRDKFSTKENILEVSLFLIVSGELIFHALHIQDFDERNQIGNFGYFQRIYLIIALCVILLIMISNLFESQVRMLTKIADLQHQLAMKDLYQAAMVHELRNPLNSVIGGVSLLNESKQICDDEKSTLQIVHHSANILMSLIGNILDVAKLEVNKVDLNQQYILFRPAIKQILDLVEFNVKKKELKLQLEISNDVPDYIYLDQSRFNQIILNLLQNAVKFTDKGFVKVLVSFSDSNKQNGVKNNIQKRNSAPGDFSKGNTLTDLINVVSYDSHLSTDKKQNFPNRNLAASQSLVSESQMMIGFRAPSYVDNSGRACRNQQFLGDGLQWQMFRNESLTTPKVMHKVFNYIQSSSDLNLYGARSNQNLNESSKQQKESRQKLSFNYADIELNQTAKFSELHSNNNFYEDQERKLLHSQNLNYSIHSNEERKIPNSLSIQSHNGLMAKEVNHTTEIFDEDFDEGPITTNNLYDFNPYSSILCPNNSPKQLINSYELANALNILNLQNKQNDNRVNQTDLEYLDNILLRDVKIQRQQTKSDNIDSIIIASNKILNQSQISRSNQSMQLQKIYKQDKFPSEISFIYSAHQNQQQHPKKKSLNHQNELLTVGQVLNPMMLSHNQSNLSKIQQKEDMFHISISGKSQSMSPSNNQDESNPPNFPDNHFTPTQSQNFNFNQLDQNDNDIGSSPQGQNKYRRIAEDLSNPVSFQQMPCDDTHRTSDDINFQPLMQKASFSSNQTVQRSKSANRLDRFRKQIKLPQIKTRASDIRSNQESSDQYNIGFGGGHPQCDILRNLSPQLDYHRVRANAPQIVQDPKLISENIQHGVIKIMIQDSGIGIKEEDQKKLFQPFCQANKSIQSKFGGTGLGLWISNKLIQLMKGTQTLKSTPNVGTTFTIEIPTDGVSFEDTNQSTNTLNSAIINLDENLSKLSILILIQDEFNKEILKKFLMKLNCQVAFAKHFDDFQAKMKLVHFFNVLIVDADQFTLSHMSKVKKLIKQKKSIEQKSKKSLSMLILSTLDIDSRQRNKYLNDRVMIFKKPVKQNILRNCLFQIQKKQKQLSIDHLRKSPKSKIRNQISEDFSARKSFQNFITEFKIQKQSPEENESEEEIKLQDKQNGSGIDSQSSKNSIKSSNGNKSQSPQVYKLYQKHLKSVAIKRELLNSLNDLNDNVQTPVFTNNFRNRALDINKIEAAAQKVNLCSQIMDHESHNVSNGKNLREEELVGLDDEDEEIKEDYGQSRNQHFRGLRPLNLEVNQNQHPLVDAGSAVTLANLQIGSQISETSAAAQRKYSSNNHAIFPDKYILIVDDEFYNSFIMEQMLLQIPEVKQMQIQILHASDGLIGYEIFKKQRHQIKLILSDLNMPNMDGKQMALLIREFENMSQDQDPVIIIGVTGDDINHIQFIRQHTRDRSGFDQICPKPVPIQALKNIIHSVFYIDQ